MRGRKPKPIEQRRREGNPGKRELPDAVVIGGRAVSLEPPAGLDEDASAFWAKAVPVLAEVGLLDVVDEGALEMLCTQYARAVQARRIIEDQGLLARGSTGQLVEHPAIATERNAAQAFLRFAEQYALTPVARTRLGLAELQRKSLAQEMEETLGKAELTPA